MHIRFSHTDRIKNFDESRFINDLHAVPWETIEYFSDINEIVEVWNKMFLEI